jgi:recombination DNA repair RAD52 pathway protein
MSFDPTQVQALSDKLNAKHVKMRCASDGALLSYIEGWHAIAEANRIFGFDAWDRQTIATQCVWQAHSAKAKPAPTSPRSGSPCAQEMS